MVKEKAVWFQWETDTTVDSNKCVKLRKGVYGYFFGSNPINILSLTQGK